MHKALTYLHLPFTDVRKAPGDTIEPEEWAAAKQTDDDIAALVANGAVSEDTDAELHPAHRDVDPSVSLPSLIAQAQQTLEYLGKSAPDEVKALATLNVVDGVDGGAGHDHN